MKSLAYVEQEKELKQEQGHPPEKISIALCIFRNETEIIEKKLKRLVRWKFGYVCLRRKSARCAKNILHIRSRRVNSGCSGFDQATPAASSIGE